MHRLLLIALALLFVVPSCAAAAEYKVMRGEVVAITDGDTIKVLDEEKREHKVRLTGINSPERKQAFYERAKQNLADLVFRREVEVHWKKHDRYGRVLGRVMVARKGCEGDCPRDVDANLAQIESGMAWWFRRYKKDQPAKERKAYEEAETRARAAKRGLWADPDPIPPENFRKVMKKKRAVKN